VPRNAAFAHEPAASMISVRPARRDAVRSWLAKPGARVLFWVKLAVAAILIGVLLSFVDWRQSLHLLGELELLLTLTAAALLAVGVALSTVKWQVLLVAHGIRVSVGRLLRYYCIGSFFSNFLPSNVGGDIVRVTLMYREGSLAIIGASILMERLTGLFVLLFLSAVGLLIRSRSLAEAGVLLPMWLSMLAMSGALGAAVFLGNQIGRWLRAPLESERLVARLVLVLIKIADALTYYQQQRKAIFVAILLSVVFYISLVLFQYSVILSVGAAISLLDVALIAPLIALVSFVPISINGLGLAEGAFVLFFTQAGLSPEEALAAAVLRRVLMTGYSLLGGLFWLREKPRLRPP